MLFIEGFSLSIAHYLGGEKYHEHKQAKNLATKVLFNNTINHRAGLYNFIFILLMEVISFLDDIYFLY